SPSRAEKHRVQTAETLAAPKSEEVVVTGARVRRRELAEQVGIAPPPSWQRPFAPPDSPSALAGGYDLEFPSVRKESLKTGGAARRGAVLSPARAAAPQRLTYSA